MACKSDSLVPLTHNDSLKNLIDRVCEWNLNVPIDNVEFGSTEAESGEHVCTLCVDISVPVMKHPRFL